jgi:uncharacterized protein (TIGR02246 family)
LDRNPVEVATALVHALETAWNAGDATAFGARFSLYADFVNTQGQYHRGRQAITWGHTYLFQTMFKGSNVRYDVINCRILVPGLISAQIAATLNCPEGLMAGENKATLSIVAREKDGDWLIEIFHNTLVGDLKP